MGEVWKARDTRLDRVVAVKVSKEQFTDRFQNEARAIAALNHPNICTLFDVGPNYLVMEFIEGAPLAGPMGSEKAVACAGQILDALDAAHRKGFVHRDLKPANILVTKQGIKLLDFGLAKQQAAARGGDVTVTQALTGQGEIAGTLQYMAPEQLHGKEADARSDLFAFGCVLYELLSGKRAFTGESAASIIAAVLERDPTPLDLVPPLDRALRTCLAKDPDDRFQNALDLKRALQWAVQETPGRPEAARSMPWGWVAAGVMAVAAIVAAWGPWRGAQSGLAQAIQVELDGGGEEISDPAISQDGQQVAFVSGRLLHVRRLDEAKARTLAGTEGAAAPFFSPDGKWLGFFANRKLLKIPVDSGAAAVLGDAVNPAGGSWDAEGGIVARMDGQGLMRISPDGRAPAMLFKGEARHPHHLPKGAGILYSAGGHVGVFGADGKVNPRLIENADRPRYLTSGHLLYSRRSELLAVRFDPVRLTLEGPEIKILEGVDRPEVRGVQFDASPSGTVVYRRGRFRSNNVISWLLPGGGVEPIYTKPEAYSSPRLSPDGKRLAIALVQQGEKNIWTLDLAQERLTRLTNGQAARGYAVWTPDGSHLIYEYSRSDLGWIRTDGGGTEQIGKNFGRSARALTPDGKHLLFNVNASGGGLDLGIADVSTANGELRVERPRVLLAQPGTQSSPFVSPDGKWVAYHSDETGQREIYVRPFPAEGPITGAKWQVSVDGGRLATWAKNSKELFWKGLDQRIYAVSYSETGGAFLAGKPRVWSDKRLPEVGTEPNFDVAPDGKRVVAVLDAGEELKPETQVRVVLNVGQILRRREAEEK